MSLEEAILELVDAVKLNTAIMDRIHSGEHRLQARGPITGVEETRGGLTHEEYQNARMPKAKTEAPNDQPKSSDTISGEQSAPTGESSSPELDYMKDVKPITIQLSKEKGREITIGVLSRFGVKSAQDLDPAQWAEYIAHCKKVLAGGGEV
jgi:hypothetical protein